MSPIFDPGRRLGLGVLILLPAMMVWSASAQPVVPRPGTKPGSPVVEDLVGSPQEALEVHRRPDHLRRRHRIAHGHAPSPQPIERPALAGVVLLAPLPRPAEPPHIVVPVPAYPLESIAAAYLTPVPPIVCHPVPREPGLPDPHLYRERTVACEPDNP